MVIRFWGKIECIIARLCMDLDLHQMTLIYDLDLYILKMYLVPKMKFQGQNFKELEHSKQREKEMRPNVLPIRIRGWQWTHKLHAIFACEWLCRTACIKRTGAMCVVCHLVGDVGGRQHESHGNIGVILNSECSGRHCKLPTSICIMWRRSLLLLRSV